MVWHRSFLIVQGIPLTGTNSNSETINTANLISNIIPTGDQFVAAEYNWLALRYDLDCRSRNSVLEKKFIDKMNAIQKPQILDIGSGSGTNILRLAPMINGCQNWTMIDRDVDLVSRIDSHYKSVSQKPAFGVTELSNHSICFGESKVNYAAITGDFLDPENEIWHEKFDAVVANAVFDLLSEKQFSQFVEIAKEKWQESKPIFYFTINLAEKISFEPVATDDLNYLPLFQNHMERPQFFGSSMGAKSARVMKQVLVESGFSVEDLSSDWNIQRNEKALLTANFDFIEDAVLTMCEKTHECEQWIKSVREKINDEKTGLLITHNDILATF